MPIHFVSQVVSNSLSLDSYGPAAAAIISIILLKKWSAGTPLLDRLHQSDDQLQQNGNKSAVQDLHGKTFIVSGGLTPYGLTILSNLSNLGCQLICLVQSSNTTHPETVQLIQLLRDGTNNQNIFAEHCSFTDSKSIINFVEKWNKGNSSIPGERPTLRRLDGILFLDQEHQSDKGLRNQIKGRVQFLEKMLENIRNQPREREVRIISSISPWYPAGIDLLQEELKACGILDSTASTSTSTSTRTFTSTPSLRKRKVQSQSKQNNSNNSPQPEISSKSNSSNPSSLRKDGSATLLWLLLSSSLQRRLDQLSLTDDRSSHSLYEAFGGDPTRVKEDEKSSKIKDHLGRDIQPPSNRNRMRNNINVLNICEGFERNRDLIDYLLPRSRTTRIDELIENDDDDGDGDNEKVDKEVDEESEEEKKISGERKKEKGEGIEIEETVSNPEIKLKNSIDPRYKSQNPLPSKSNSNSNLSSSNNKNPTKRTNPNSSISTSSSSSPQTSNPLSLFSTLIRYSILMILYPFIWLFSKSPSSASQSLIWSVISPVSDLSRNGNLDPNLNFDEQNSSTHNLNSGNGNGNGEIGKQEEIKRNLNELKLIPGELYREGKIVALSLPSILLENGSTIPSASDSTSTSKSYSPNRTPTALPISSIPTEVLSRLWEAELKD